MERGPRLPFRAPVGAGGQFLGQRGHAPARKLVRIRHAAHREPALAIGDDADLVSAAVELLRRQRGALRTAQFLRPGLEAVLIDKVDGNRVLSAIRLD